MTERTILHVDLDAFFAAVEQRDRPELRGRPVIVGGEPGGRGVVSAASYEARVVRRPLGDVAAGGLPALPRRRVPAGRRPALPAGVARRDGHPSPLHATGRADLDRRGVPRRDRVARAARRRRDDRGGDQGGGPRGGRADGVGRGGDDQARGQDRVRPAQAGRARRRAARARRRRSSTPLPISRLWGVGEKTAVALAEYGVRTIGDLAALPPDIVVRRFGKHGGVAGRARAGHRRRPGVHEGDPAKSVGHEHTFDDDTSDPEVIERTLLALADGVAGRLRSAGVRASTIAVKIRDSSFRTITRQRTLPEPTDLTEPIYPGRAGPGPTGGARDARPAAGGHGLEPGRARATRRCSRPTIPSGGRPSRRPTPCVDATDHAR